MEVWRLEIATVQEIIFMNKQNIPWNDVEKYQKNILVGHLLYLNIMI